MKKILPTILLLATPLIGFAQEVRWHPQQNNRHVLQYGSMDFQKKLISTMGEMPFYATASEGDLALFPHLKGIAHFDATPDWVINNAEGLLKECLQQAAYGDFPDSYCENSVLQGVSNFEEMMNDSSISPWTRRNAMSISSPGGYSYFDFGDVTRLVYAHKRLCRGKADNELVEVFGFTWPCKN